jgi:hypothetical protein
MVSEIDCTIRRGIRHYSGSARSRPGAPWLSTGLDVAAAGFLGGPADIFAAAAAAHRTPLGMTLLPEPMEVRRAEVFPSLPAWEEEKREV